MRRGETGRRGGRNEWPEKLIEVAARLARAVVNTLVRPVKSDRARDNAEQGIHREKYVRI